MKPTSSFAGDLNANSTNSSQNSSQDVKNSQANFLTNLKQIFALPKWARIFLAVLSVIALLGLCFGGALQIWAKDKNFSANLVFNSQNSHATLSSGEFAYKIRAHFESLDFLLRSKTIAKIKIAQISWDESRINPSQILSYEAQSLKFHSAA